MQVADDDETGRDSDPRLQAAIAQDVQRVDPFDRLQRGMNGPLGVVLVRFGITEVDELAVA